MASLDLKQLRALAVVLEVQSFDKAAKILHLTQSAVSQRVKQLEEQLGQPLIVRGTPLTPTTAGQRVLRGARQITLIQDELLGELGGPHRAYTNVPIGLNADSLATWFFDAVQPVIEQHDLLIELKVDDQDETHRLLKSGEVMACISSSELPMQGCRCEPLGEMHYRAVASSHFMKRYFSEGITRDAILNAPMVESTNKDQLQYRYLRQFYDLRDERVPTHRIPSPDSYLDFIRRGLGWGLVPEIQLPIGLQSSDLTDLRPGETISVPLFWHCWNLKSSFIREISKAIVDHARGAVQK